MLATVQLDTHFVEPGKIGEILVSKPHVVRSTRSLIFITTDSRGEMDCFACARNDDLWRRRRAWYVSAFAEKAPHPNPLPVKNGARELTSSHFCKGPTPCNTATSAAAA